jgi:hypothetical protein
VAFEKLAGGTAFDATHDGAVSLPLLLDWHQ